MINDLDLLRIHHAVGGAGRMVRMSQYGASEAEIEGIMRNSGLGFVADISGKIRQACPEDRASTQTAECVRR